ncbi:uncharacterized protein [Argopecten irradians]|uniref:uncharacterized protein n=1 Tax=Argopecten irradians TaxID=31199 RepID=UPI00371D7B41
MFCRFRFRLVTSVTLLCVSLLVWLLVLSSRNFSSGSETTWIFQQFGQVLYESNRPHKQVLPLNVKDTLKMLPNCPNENGNKWNFKCIVKCQDPSLIVVKTHTRPKLPIRCKDISVEGVIRSEFSVPVYNFTDKCLRNELYIQCSDGQPVSNIVHYIFFGMQNLSFVQFLSIWSIHTIQKPCVILVHGDTQLSGPYWTYLVRAIPNIIRVRRMPPTHIFGIPIKLVEHQADVARLEAVKEFGGIYMDTDEILIRSLDPLRKYNFTLSHELDINLSNGLIMSARNASFLNVWYNEYATFDGVVWAHHSTIVPYQLSQKYPHLIHIEKKTFVNPDYTNVDMIFKENFNWSNNYAIHLYIRYYKVEHNFTDIRHLNTTLGSVARHVLYGIKELCSD